MTPEDVQLLFDAIYFLCGIVCALIVATTWRG